MAKSYRVVTITGKNAEHGQLTYNKQVEKQIINFYGYNSKIKEDV